MLSAAVEEVSHEDAVQEGKGNLRVGYQQPAGGKYESDEGGAEEHFDDGHIALLVLVDLCKRFAAVYPVAFVGAHGETGEVLVEGDKVHGIGHGVFLFVLCLYV